MVFTSAFGIGCAARVARWTRRAAPALLALAMLPGATGVSGLTVDVTSMRSAKGMLRVCLTSDPGNFPNCLDDADAITRSVPAGEHALNFTGLPRGNYAVAVIHDENGNAKLDTFAGVPREGFGFSRNPRILFGPPRFTAARFTLAGDADVQQVKMRYLL